MNPGQGHTWVFSFVKITVKNKRHAFAFINIFFSIPATKFFIVSNVHPIDRCQIYRGGCAMAMAMYGYGYGC